MRITIEFETSGSDFEAQGVPLGAANVVRAAALKVEEILERTPVTVCDAPEEADLVRDANGNVIGRIRVESDDEIADDTDRAAQVHQALSDLPATDGERPEVHMHRKAWDQLGQPGGVVVMGHGPAAYDDLGFDELRQVNVGRVPSFGHGPLDAWDTPRWFMAMTGEVGELGNLLKKVERGDFTLEAVHDEVGREIADVVIYLDLLAARLEHDLGACVRAKWNEVSERVGYDERL